MKTFCFNYNKFTLRSKRIFYGTHMGESFVVALIIGLLFFNSNTIEFLSIVFIPVLLTPVGIAYVGGFTEIKKRFMKKHGLSEVDFL